MVLRSQSLSRCISPHGLSLSSSSQVTSRDLPTCRPDSIISPHVLKQKPMLIMSTNNVHSWKSVIGSFRSKMDRNVSFNLTSILPKSFLALNIDLPKYVIDYPQQLVGQVKNYMPYLNIKAAKKEDHDDLNRQSTGRQTSSTNNQEVVDHSFDSMRENETLIAGDRLSRDGLDFSKHSLVSITDKNNPDPGSSMSNIYSNFVSSMADAAAASMSENNMAASAPKDSTEANDNKADAAVSSTYLQQMMSHLRRSPQPPLAKKKSAIVSQSMGSLSRTAIDKKTRALVQSLKLASSNTSRLVRLEELCKHLSLYPDTKNVATKEKVLPILLRLRTYRRDEHLRERAAEALALVGYVDPVRARGIRILSLDGGGTKGLVTISLLRHLTELTGQPIHQTFDLICGVSTGALIGVLLGAFRVSMDECDRLYRIFSSEMFSRNRIKGTSRLVRSYAYYDSALWERILRENIGLKTLRETAGDPSCPKIAAASTLVNVVEPVNYLFRNYNVPAGAQSHYPGSRPGSLWQAIRASSAAPGYFEEFKLDENVHQDGGVMANNPCAIAVHEGKLLWPDTPIQCVVSVGTGRSVPTFDSKAESDLSLKLRVLALVHSATNTEGVHTIMHDLLPPSTYFRFNPYISETFDLDEIRPEKWDQMIQDTAMFCRRNELKLSVAASKLNENKLPHQRALEWLKLKAKMIS